MNVPSDEDTHFIVLLGALCVGSAIVGIFFGMRRAQAARINYFALASLSFGFLAACTIVSFLWMQWIDYDNGIQAAVDSAKMRGYEIRREERSDGIVVYKIKNYIIPDGSFSVLANRSPFRPEWLFVAKRSLLGGVVGGVISILALCIARRYSGHDLSDTKSTSSGPSG